MQREIERLSHLRQTLETMRIKIPSDIVPDGYYPITGIDCGSPDGDCTVKSIVNRLTGEAHIVEVIYNPPKDGIN